MVVKMFSVIFTQNFLVMKNSRLRVKHNQKLMSYSRNGVKVIQKMMGGRLELGHHQWSCQRTKSISNPLLSSIRCCVAGFQYGLWYNRSKLKFSNHRRFRNANNEIHHKS